MMLRGEFGGPYLFLPTHQRRWAFFAHSLVSHRVDRLSCLSYFCRINIQSVVSGNRQLPHPFTRTGPHIHAHIHPVNYYQEITRHRPDLNTAGDTSTTYFSPWMVHRTTPISHSIAERLLRHRYPCVITSHTSVSCCVGFRERTPLHRAAPRAE